MKNIYLAYTLAFLKNTWFWLGIWVFYYLKFTDYAGIGLIETVLIITMTLTEIPTGAIADLLGKRKTLIIAFFFELLCAFSMAFATNIEVLMVSVFLGGVGASLYSGTLDALVYDTLKQHGLEKGYDRINANINSIYLIAPALCSIMGGFMYVLSPRLPFLANGIAYLIGFILCFFLEEPLVDSAKFTLANFVSQTKMGINQLFKAPAITKQTILLLSVGVIVVIGDEMLNSFLGVEFGFNEALIGVIWAAIYIISAVVVQVVPKLRQVMGDLTAMIGVGLIMAVSLLVSPWMGLVAGGMTILVRSICQALYSSLTSVVINNNTESKYRATTISTFNMIKNIPYVLAAFLIGSLSAVYSAKFTALVLGTNPIGITCVPIVPDKISEDSLSQSGIFRIKK